MVGCLLVCLIPTGFGLVVGWLVDWCCVLAVLWVVWIGLVDAVVAAILVCSFVFWFWVCWLGDAGAGCFDWF